MNILYAEDERQLSDAVAEILKMEGYDVDAVYNGADAWEHSQVGAYDVIILDIMMPKMDGISVLKKIRDSQDYTPVILLTAKTQNDDKISGLSTGADDYLGKPFSMGELVARIDALVRREKRYKLKSLSIGNISLDMESNRLESDVGGLVISNREAQLLSCFMRGKESRFSIDRLLEVMPNEFQDEKTALLYISYIRNKLTQLQANVNILQDGEDYYMGESAGASYE